MEQALLTKLENFFSQFKLLHYPKGGLILRAGDDPPGVFYLKSGHVRLYATTQDGRELTLNIFKPGSYFSMMWAVGDAPNAYFFEAMTPVEIWRAPKEQVITFIRQEPQILFELMRRILVGLNGLLNTMEYLFSQNAAKRVASVLVTLAKRFGQKEGLGETLIQLPLTHQMIATLAGLTRETTSLEMKKWQKRGLIDYEKRSVLIKDLAQFEKESLINTTEENLPHAF